MPTEYSTTHLLPSLPVANLIFIGRDCKKISNALHGYRQRGL